MPATHRATKAKNFLALAHTPHHTDVLPNLDLLDLLLQVFVPREERGHLRSFGRVSGYVKAVSS